MEGKDKRNDIRIPLLSEAARVMDSFSSEYDKVLDMSDVAKGGVFFKTTDFPKLHLPVTVIFAMPGDLGNIAMDGEVCRIVWRANKKRNLTQVGFAVRFNPIVTPGTEKIWEAYRTYLRNKQIISVSKRIIEEFFGPGGPPKGTYK